MFVTHSIRLGGSAFICLFTVRENLRIPVRRVALYTALFTVAVCLVISILAVGSFSSVGIMVLSLVCGGIFLVRVTEETPAKLVFLLLVVGCFAYFCLSVWGLFYSVIPILDITSVTYLEIPVCVAVYGILTPPFLLGLTRLWRQARQLKDAPWRSLCGISTMFIVLYYCSIALQEMGQLDDLTRTIIDLFITACAFITYWQMVTMLMKSTEAARYAERLRSTDNQLLLQAELLRGATTHDAEIRQLRHDMRHHFVTLEAMLGENGNARALAYLREYIGRVEETAVPPVCENAVADATCRRYIALAGRQNTQTDVAVEIPDRLGIADSDLAVLLGNLWENALEACARRATGGRYIRLRAKTIEHGLMISMTNSFDGVIRMREGAGGEPVFLSLKRGGTEEGIGIASIRAIAKRYHGMEETTSDADSFHIRVLLYADAQGQT